MIIHFLRLMRYFASYGTHEQFQLFDFGFDKKLGKN